MAGGLRGFVRRSSATDGEAGTVEFLFSDAIFPASRRGGGGGLDRRSRNLLAFPLKALRNVARSSQPDRVSISDKRKGHGGTGGEPRAPRRTLPQAKPAGRTESVLRKRLQAIRPRGIWPLATGQIPETTFDAVRCSDSSGVEYIVSIDLLWPGCLRDFQ